MVFITVIYSSRSRNLLADINWWKGANDATLCPQSRQKICGGLTEQPLLCSTQTCIFLVVEQVSLQRISDRTMFVKCFPIRKAGFFSLNDCFYFDVYREEKLAS